MAVAVFAVPWMLRMPAPLALAALKAMTSLQHSRIQSAGAAVPISHMLLASVLGRYMTDPHLYCMHARVHVPA